MDSELVAVCAVQIMVLGIVVAAIVVYLLKHLMSRSRTDVAGKTLVITGCDATLGFELARHYDKCGFRVFACCARPSGEAAVRLQSEASTRLQIVELDVTSLNSLAAASKSIKDQLLPSEKGSSLVRRYIAFFATKRRFVSNWFISPGIARGSARQIECIVSIKWPTATRSHVLASRQQRVRRWHSDRATEGHAA